MVELKNDSKFVSAKNNSDGDIIKFLNEGAYAEKTIQGEKKTIFEISVQHDGFEKICSIGKISKSNLSPVYGMDTKDWVGKYCKVKIGKAPNGKDYMFLEPCSQEQASKDEPKTEWESEEEN